MRAEEKVMDWRDWVVPGVLNIRTFEGGMFWLVIFPLCLAVIAVGIVLMVVR